MSAPCPARPEERPGEGRPVLENRERKIRLWFGMWLDKADRGISRLFAPEAVYIESWGPEYHGSAQIRHWFEEWNTRGTVLQWDIRQFFHRGDQTVVEWCFRNQMADGAVEAFDGMSLIRWTGEGQIAFLQEFGCNLDRYDPYQGGEEPRFREEKPRWF